MSADPVHQLVEDICKLGCTRVNEIIDTLQAGQSTPETHALDHLERLQLLAELKSIMAVYEKRR